jgi:hypothetical protein
MCEISQRQGIAVLLARQYAKVVGIGQIEIMPGNALITIALANSSLCLLLFRPWMKNFSMKSNHGPAK